MNLDLMTFLQEAIYLELKDGAYVINLTDKNSKGANQVSLFIDKNAAVYFDAFGNEYIPLEVLNKTKCNQLLTTYLEYKIMNLLCVDFIASLSQNTFLEEKLYQIIQTCFLRITIKRATK